jgi:hypothetical protein
MCGVYPLRGFSVILLLTLFPYFSHVFVQQGQRIHPVSTGTTENNPMANEPAESRTTLGKKHALLLMAWLLSHQGAVKAGELSTQLGILLEIYLPPRQKLYVLEALFSRLSLGLEAQVAQFVGVGIPLSAHTYRQVNALLDVLGDFSLGYESVLAALPEQAPEDDIRLCLERVIFCLYQHLLVSYLVGRPASLGLWQRLHGAYLRSRQSTQAPIPGYAEALLLASAQPRSFSSQEFAHVIECAQQLAAELQITETAPETPESAFWIPAQQDFHAFPLNRRAPPPGARVFYFSCQRVVAHIEAYLQTPNKNDADLPLAFQWANTKNSQRILQRLLVCWGNPGQRRFPRHRKSYRGILCIGLDKTHLMLKAPDTLTPNDYSGWMITNESPDGYTLMLLHGNPNRIGAGEVVSLRSDPSDHIGKHHIKDPLVGLIRWAASETPEHVEIGVQILSAAATPATLSLPDNPNQRVAALLLPKQPPLHNLPGLVIPANIITEQDYDTVLVEKEAQSFCPVHILKIREKNRSIEIFSIVDAMPSQSVREAAPEEAPESGGQEVEFRQEIKAGEPGEADQEPAAGT